MEVQNGSIKSIWGIWWEPIRKWFYPTWLLYELSFRFYQYALDTHNYLYEIFNPVIAVSTAVLAFGSCTAFLTISACYILHQFFVTENLTNTSFEEKIKRYF